MNGAHKATGASAESAPTLAEVIAVLEDAYPPALAESWDAVGLVAGDPADHVGVGADRPDVTGRAAGTGGTALRRD